MNQAAIAESICRRVESAEWKRSPVGTRFAIIDDVLPAGLATQLYNAFNLLNFDRRSSFREKKATSHALDRHPAILGDAARAMMDPALLSAIGELTDIAALEPDPSLYAGGLSMMIPGDFLNPHIDNSHDGKRRRYRRLNLLYYVTPDWSADDGGSLELWDDSVSRPFTIPARFNRLVIMETNRHSWHSVNRITGRGARCCISSYYFTKASPTGDDYYHVTSFMGRPEQRMRRVIAPADNTLRRIARHMGARRRADAGGNHAAS